MGEVVGVIHPPEDGGPPVYRIVRGDYDAGPNVRPCHHARYVLDPEWRTVTCSTCGERIDPFAVLLSHARWEESVQRKTAALRDARKKLAVEELRRIRRLRALTDAERAEVDTILSRHWQETPDNLNAAVTKWREVVRDRKVARRRERGQR